MSTGRVDKFFQVSLHGTHKVVSPHRPVITQKVSQTVKLTMFKSSFPGDVTECKGTQQSVGGVYNSGKFLWLGIQNLEFSSKIYMDYTTM